MVRVIAPDDCNNAPRKEVIRDFNVAFATVDREKILAYMADDIEWIMIGDKKMQGKDAAKAFLETMPDEKAEEVVLHTIVTHGNTAAANGEIRYKDMTIAFCDVYEFAGFTKDAKIKKLTSYAVELT